MEASTAKAYLRCRAWGGKCVVMRLNLGGESLVFDAKGNPYGALTNHSLFDRFFTKDVFRFGKPFKGGEKIDLWVEGVASNIQGQAIFPWDPHSTREKYPAGRSNPGPPVPQRRCRDCRSRRPAPWKGH